VKPTDADICTVASVRTKGAQRRAQPLPPREQFLIADVFDDQRKLVAAEAGEMRGLAAACAQPFADGDEQFVTYGVTVDIVDRLEPVEIENADGEPVAVRPRQLEFFIQPGKKLAAVGQAGETVEIRQAKVLVAHGLHAGLSVDHPGEVAVVAHQDEASRW
jgi:hypothetical protein